MLKRSPFRFKLSRLDCTPLESLSALITQKPPNVHAIVTEVISLRRQFGLGWYLADEFRPKLLRETMAVLLKLMGLDIPPVTVAAYNAFGALLMVLTPFFPKQIMTTFSNVVQDIDDWYRREMKNELCRSIAICIVSGFVFLAHHVAPHRLEDFLEAVIGWCYFPGDDIDRLPNLTRNMRCLGAGFNRQMALKIVMKFASHPKPSVIESLECILDAYPSVVGDVLELITTKYRDTFLCLGKFLIDGKHEMFELYVTDEHRRLLFTDIKASFASALNTEMLPYYVECLSYLQGRPNELGAEVMAFVDELLASNFPTHVMRQLLFLVHSLDQIEINGNEASTDLVMKIRALSNLVDNKNCDKVIDILLPILKAGGNEFYAAVELLEQRFKLIFRLANRQKLAVVLETLFAKAGSSLSGKVAVASFLKVADQFLCEEIVFGYIDMAIAFLADALLSDYDVLSAIGREAMIALAGLHNIARILDLLRKYDVWNLAVSLRLLILLNSLVDSFDVHKSDTGLWCYFARIFGELAGICDSQQVQSEAFLYLSHFPDIVNGTNGLLENICSEMMDNQYGSFTGLPLFPGRFKSTNKITSVLASVTTDIVADPVLTSSHEILRPLLNGYKFLASIHAESLFDVSLALVDLFPEEVIPAVMSLELSPEQMRQFSAHLGILFNYYEQWKVSALVADFLFEKIDSVSEDEFHRLRCAAQTKGIGSADVATSLFRALYKYNKKEAMNIMLCMLSQIQLQSHLEANNFLVSIREYLAIEEYRNQYPFLAVGSEDESGVLEWCNSTPFQYWPLRDEQFRKNFVSFLQKHRDNKISIDNLVDSDDEHLRFLVENIRFFEFAGFAKYVDEHKRELRHVCVFGESGPRFKLDFNISSLSKLASISPMMAQGKYILDTGLLRSFFRHSRVVISSALFTEIHSKLQTDEQKSEAADYAQRNGLTTKEDSGLLNEFSHKKSYLKQLLIQIAESNSDELGRFCVKNVNFGAVSKPKTLFLMFRLLRSVPILSRTLVEDLLKSYQSTNSCQVREIIQDTSHSWVMKEFSDLITACLPQSLPEVTECTLLNNMLTRYQKPEKGQKLVIEKPSDSIAVLRLHENETDDNWLQLSMADKWTMRNPIVAQALLSFVQQHPESIRYPDTFLKYLLRLRCPGLFIVNPDFVLHLLKKVGGDIFQFQDSIETVLCGKGEYIPHVIMYISTYYQIITRLQGNMAPVDNEIVQRARRIFLANQSTLNGTELANCLATENFSSDSIPIWVDLFVKPVQFLPLIVMASKLARQPEHRETVFNQSLLDMIREAVPYKSRLLALETLMNGGSQAAVFLCAASETNDEALISQILGSANI